MLDLHRFLFLRFIDLHCLVAGINVDSIMSDESGFGHEEDDEQEHQYHRTAHPMHSDAKRAFFDDRTRDRTSQIDASKHAQVEDSHSEATFMDMPDISDRCRNQGLERSHTKAL